MKRNLQIKELFLKNYSKAKTELQFSNLYELLVCVMLSAQCTDKRVNSITPKLFAAYPNIQSLAKAKLGSLKTYIQSCSFFNNKALNLIKMAQTVCEKFSGQIPLDEKNLKSLAGVGQKTAHVVLIEWCGANYMAVDTHVFRVSHRLGLSKAKTPELTEFDLNTIFKDKLNILHQAMVLFGRYTCKARNPLCGECFLQQLCKSKDKKL
ncbi:endonuclease III [Campylobacter sp. MIT 21-1685]|uniref:endonuclease III n=1 Tax=unclassified Campylobacter TaxID=2593542 RepID=UPI00224AFEC5|nr:MULTISPECIES: endonuclease III [unclassified Campylobacter]MCX2682350.1 endonuclease III [Campylobacter sp. MIT 21-1684]MCX2750630.1 endonuclease III [Campylobacter sp. MIT 21-1682]MCX2806822.1 endonuclease III [Campylobacter sp. MIT 21-1685]